MPNATGTSRYIIRATGDGPALDVFVANIRAHPAVRLVDAIGPREHPHTVVIETDAATARQLEESFRSTNQLMIEPDRPLSLFD